MSPDAGAGRGWACGMLHLLLRGHGPFPALCLLLLVACTHRQLGRVMYPADCTTPEGMAVVGAQCEDIGRETRAAVSLWREHAGSSCHIDGTRVEFHPRAVAPEENLSQYHHGGVIHIYATTPWQPLLHHEIWHHCAFQNDWPVLDHHPLFDLLGLDG